MTHSKPDIRQVLNPDGRSTGLVRNMNRAEYKAIPRLNCSTICCGLLGTTDLDVRLIRDSFGVDKKFKTAKQDQLDCGTLGHIALIEPQRLATDVAIWGGKIRSGNAWDEFQLTHCDKLIIREADYNDVLADVQSLRSRESVARFVRDVDAEVAVFATEQAGMATYSGPMAQPIRCKGLVDIISVPKRMICDVKFTEAGIDAHSVLKTIRALFYREKMAAYRRWIAQATGTDKESWSCWNLFLSRSGSLGVNRVKYTSSALQFGEARMMQAIDAVAHALATDEWPMLDLETMADVAPWEIEDVDLETLE